MRIIDDDKFLGYEGESYFRTINFEIEDKYKNYDVYLEFHTIKDNKYYVSKKLDITKSYLIPYVLLKQKGYIKAQLIAYKDNDIVGKSDPVTFFVKESINARDVIIATEGYDNLKEVLKEELKEYVDFLFNQWISLPLGKLVVEGTIEENKLTLKNGNVEGTKLYI